MQTALTAVKPGQAFTYGGITWVKLNDTEETTLCIAAERVTKKAFDEGSCNDWRGSTLRQWLNADAGRTKSGEGFLADLLDNGAEHSAFAPIVSDLTADNGMTDYGTAEDYIALLSCDQYRKYRALIPPVDNWCWTLTPWSCLKDYSDSVRFVDTDGTLDYDSAYRDNWGVRPLCNLLSEILVSVEDDTEADEKTQDTALADLGHEIGVIVADCLREVADIFDDRNHTGG